VKEKSIASLVIGAPMKGRAEIKPINHGLSSFDLIFVGDQIRGNNLSTPLNAFIAQTDFINKIINNK
jgi:hypothetical protein